MTKAKTERATSSAMKMYLQRKREHDMFISRERAEFDVGKSHLASMMGLEVATMDQADIDRSIEYLFPSGLALEARPVMKPPEEIYPRQKEAEFDMEGRPFHPFFYTLKPHFNEAVYKLRDHLEAVTIFGDRLARQGKGPDPEQVSPVPQSGPHLCPTGAECREAGGQSVDDPVRGVRCLYRVRVRVRVQGPRGSAGQAGQSPLLVSCQGGYF